MSKGNIEMFFNYQEAYMLPIIERDRRANNIYKFWLKIFMKQLSAIMPFPHHLLGAWSPQDLQGGDATEGKSHHSAYEILVLQPYQ